MVSIEARDGVTTGISAHDRARTIAVAVDPAAGPDDVVEPGHVFPLRASAGGVLEHAGAAEAAVDLAAASGAGPAAVLCTILDATGAVATGDDLRTFAREHRLPVTTLGAVVAAARARQPSPPRR